jgi:hypothetical protein
VCAGGNKLRVYSFFFFSPGSGDEQLHDPSEPQHPPDLFIDFLIAASSPLFFFFSVIQDTYARRKDKSSRVASGQTLV